MRLTVFSVIVLYAICSGRARATICQPLSKFYVDCNVCRCSESGREYSCTMQTCVSSNKDYIKVETDDGYVLLQQREDSRERYVLDDKDRFEGAPRRIRHSRIPYIKDTIEPRSANDVESTNDINDPDSESILLSTLRKTNNNENNELYETDNLDGFEFSEDEDIDLDEDDDVWNNIIPIERGY